MNIICGHDFRNLAQSLTNFEMDLGRAYTKKDEIKQTVESNITDEFVVLFYREYKRLIYKVGRLGPINFYTFDRLPSTEIWVYDKNKQNKVLFDKQLARLDFKKYFANVIYDVKNKEIE